MQFASPITDSNNILARCIFEETTIPNSILMYTTFEIIIRIPYSLPGMSVFYASKIEDYLEENFNISRLYLTNDYYETIDDDFNNKKHFKILVYKLSEECFCEMLTLLKLKGYC